MLGSYSSLTNIRSREDLTKLLTSLHNMAKTTGPENKMKEFEGAKRRTSRMHIAQLLRITLAGTIFWITGRTSIFSPQKMNLHPM